MSTTYQGRADQVSRPADRSVEAASNASPIVVETDAPHKLYTGDVVAISGVQGNTAANGVFVVTVLSPTEYSLNGSAGNGALTSPGSGTTRCYSMRPAAQLVSDGDGKIKASQVTAALQLLLDRSAAVSKRLAEADNAPLFQSVYGAHVIAGSDWATHGSAWKLRTSGVSGGAQGLVLTGLPHGSTLLSVAPVFAIAAHAAIPQYLPSVTVNRISLSGAAMPQSLISTGGGSVTMPTPGSTADYVASSGRQSFIATVDQNNEIDVENYAYVALFTPESGTDAEDDTEFYGFRINVSGTGWLPPPA